VAGRRATRSERIASERWSPVPTTSADENARSVKRDPTRRRDDGGDDDQGRPDHVHDDDIGSVAEVSDDAATKRCRALHDLDEYGYT